jgi:transposase
MDSHTISALNRLEVVDTGRRRRWSEEEKARIVLESMSGPRLVSATARRHGLSRSLLVTWRRAQGFDGRNSETGFVPAMIAADAPAAPATSSSRLEATNGSERRIEIALACGRRVFFDAHVDVEALSRIVEVLDRR